MNGRCTGVRLDKTCAATASTSSFKSKKYGNNGQFLYTFSMQHKETAMSCNTEQVVISARKSKYSLSKYFFMTSIFFTVKKTFSSNIFLDNMY